MSGLLPVAVYGLKIPAGDVLVPANIDFPATFRITMAAIDPSAAPEHSGTTNGDTLPRATLKIIYDPNGPGEDEDSEDDSEDEDYLKGLLEGVGSDEDDDEDESSDDEEEKNGGPSDPSKSKKARKQAAVEQMMKALAEIKSDDEMDDAPAVNGVVSKKKKGKAKATDSDEESSEEGEDDELPEMEELVLCTLDPSKNCQQPLDLTVGEDQRAFFKVSGTHAIYLTGNYVVPADDGHNKKHEVYDEDDSEDYDLSPDEDELDDEEESDDLDDLEDPRIMEIGSDEEEEAPKLIKKEVKAQKGKNKRVAEDSDEEPANLDDIMAKSLKPAEPITNGEPKLSKKQLKKLKNNAGKAVEAAVEAPEVRKEEKKNGKKEEPASKDADSSKTDKKVQFAKNLEQGPAVAMKDKKAGGKADAKAGAKADVKSETKKEGEKPKATLGPKTVQGVKIDDKKLGQGPASKKGNKVGMRYIGKLEDGKVFDANKKGKPFQFKLGSGEVIKGWDIGVAGMSVGGERRITVPAHLAYGSKSLPGIPPNSTLIFDIKCLEIL